MDFTSEKKHGLHSAPPPDKPTDVLACRLSAKYGFEKPNDRRALDLMNAAAIALMKEVPDILLGYGISDEFR